LHCLLCQQCELGLQDAVSSGMFVESGDQYPVTCAQVALSAYINHALAILSAESAQPFLVCSCNPALSPRPRCQHPATIAWQQICSVDSCIAVPTQFSTSHTHCSVKQKHTDMQSDILLCSLQHSIL
jgi:hypothetical protein